MKATTYKQLETIDVIAEELLKIEESAKMIIGCSTLSDQCLTELNFPSVSELIHVPVR